MEVSACEWCGLETDRTEEIRRHLSPVYCCEGCKPRFMRFSALVSGIGNPFEGLDGRGVDSEGRATINPDPDYPRIGDKPWVAGSVGGANIATSDAKAFRGFADALNKARPRGEKCASINAKPRKRQPAVTKAKSAPKSVAAVAPGDPLAALRAAVRARGEAEAAVSSALVSVREAGGSMTKAAQALGVSRQAAYKALERAGA